MAHFIAKAEVEGEPFKWEVLTKDDYSATYRMLVGPGWIFRHSEFVQGKDSPRSITTSMVYVPKF
jgi:hypothetical protein